MSMCNKVNLVWWRWETIWSWNLKNNLKFGYFG